ncbi:MAG: hypothetical protein ACRELX_07580, partial [Longimicrobiales bacterium]
TVLVEGKDAQMSTLRWEDYTQLSMDPVDDCTMWYVGDYLKQGATRYTTRIGAFRLPDCLQATVSGTMWFDVNRNGVREPNEPGLPDWQVAYAGVADWQDRVEPPSGTLTTDDAGDYSITLPADPAYFTPIYTFTARASAHPAWSRSARGSAFASAPIPMTNGAYTIRLSDREDVTHASFGNACTLTNTGGQPAAHWAGNAGAAVLRTNDEQPAEPRRGRRGRGGRDNGGEGWRNLLNARFLVDTEGARLVVRPGTFDDAYAPIRPWLAGDSPNAAHRLSTRLATTALNVAYGQQDGNVTVHDPVSDDWPTVSALLGRISDFIEEHATTTAADPARVDAASYASLLDALNGNIAQITPVTPARCPAPF